MRKRLSAGVSLVTLLVLLGACGTGGGPGQASSGTPAGNPSPVPEPLAATDDNREVIVAFGDSLTAGYGVEPGQSYPDFLQRRIDESGYQYQVVNEGISGDTSGAGLVRTELVASRDPRFVIVTFGGNDGLRGLSVETMETNLREIITQLQEQGASVILGGMKLPPNYGADYTKSFESVYPRLADEFGVPLVPFILEGVGGFPSLMLEDGIHPNPKGNEHVAQNVWAVLEPILSAKAD